MYTLKTAGLNNLPYIVLSSKIKYIIKALQILKPNVESKLILQKVVKVVLYFVVRSVYDQFYLIFFLTCDSLPRTNKLDSS